MHKPRLDDIALIAERITRSVTEVRGRAASPDHGVTVEVDSTGRITDLTVSETAVRAGADHLVSTLVHTHHATRNTRHAPKQTQLAKRDSRWEKIFGSALVSSSAHREVLEVPGDWPPLKAR